MRKTTFNSSEESGYVVHDVLRDLYVNDSKLEKEVNKLKRKANVLSLAAALYLGYKILKYYSNK